MISEITTMSLETQDLSVLDSVIATLTLIILDRIESFITMRSKKLRDFLKEDRVISFIEEKYNIKI